MIALEARQAAAQDATERDSDEDSQFARATARRLAELHAAGDHELAGHCWWCLKTWPCPDRQWSERVLRDPSWALACH
ncbi:MAG: hypothetical protein QOD41_3808 [Cryptosporangiaceae bacterium]|nr:hypothetical protein [Cryptosporangiaceae bacterium]